MHGVCRITLICASLRLRDGDYQLTPQQSLHASAFVSRLSVRSLTEPPPITLVEPVVVSTYPFAVSLTTDRPFLAEVTLSLVGELNPDIVIQHWVEVRSRLFPTIRTSLSTSIQVGSIQTREVRSRR